MRYVVAAIMVRGDGKVLVCQRTKHQPLPLKWEFPGGKIEEGEQPEQALVRELEEELGIQARIGPLVSRFVHEYRNGRAVDLAFYHVTDYTGEIENRIFKDIRWVERAELPALDFLEADVKLVREIASGKII